MSTLEARNAEPVTNPVGLYHIAATLDDTETAWFHVVEWNAAKGMFVSIYRAASLEDAQDVLGIYTNEAE